MIKREVLRNLKKSKGHIPNRMLFDLYEENEDIPKNIIDAFSTEYKPPGSDAMICSKELAEQLNKINDDQEK